VGFISKSFYQISGNLNFKKEKLNKYLLTNKKDRRNINRQDKTEINDEPHYFRRVVCDEHLNTDGWTTWSFFIR